VETLLYYFFDSHSRPQIGRDGAYLYSNTNKSEIIGYLNHLFSIPTSGNNLIVDQNNLDEVMYNSMEYMYISMKKSATV